MPAGKYRILAYTSSMEEEGAGEKLDELRVELEIEVRELGEQEVSMVWSSCACALAAQDWALSNGRENLCRVGGMPSWIEDAQYPSCPECRETMAFISSIPSCRWRTARNGCGAAAGSATYSGATAAR
ncbi:hypothetical protein [Paenibacillus thiaminolyticus]|uniref:hypothetical protein n=1 Tax=Paenibacillus thiaminolyticus TaxID=49283 RepID=UPI0011C3F8F6|nr:hypothetical protein [Paenibacillus thiaminolyticus]